MLNHVAVAVRQALVGGKTKMRMMSIGGAGALLLLYSIEEPFVFFIHYFPNTIFATSFSDNQFKVRKLFKVSLYLA